MVKYRIYLNEGREWVIVSFEDEERAINAFRFLAKHGMPFWGFKVDGQFIGVDSRKISAIVPEEPSTKSPRSWFYWSTEFDREQD